MDTKQRILHAAIQMVEDGANAQSMTTRSIAKRAGVNAALVNYYYGSKEVLLGQVVGAMMQDIVDTSIDVHKADEGPYQRLEQILLTTADAAFQHQNICQIAIEQELKAECVHSCNLVMPLLREMMPSFPEQALKIKALQLMMPFHRIVLNPEHYQTYFGVDIADAQRRRQMIQQMIKSAIGSYEEY